MGRFRAVGRLRGRVPTGPQGRPPANFTAATIAELNTLLSTTIPTAGGAVVDLTADVVTDTGGSRLLNITRRFDSKVIIRSDNPSVRRKLVTTGTGNIQEAVQVQGARNIEFQDLHIGATSLPNGFAISADNPHIVRVIANGSTPSENIVFRRCTVEGHKRFIGADSDYYPSEAYGSRVGFSFYGTIGSGLIECSNVDSAIGNFAWFQPSGLTRGQSNFMRGCLGLGAAADFSKTIGQHNILYEWNEWECRNWAVGAHSDGAQLTVRTGTFGNADYRLNDGTTTDGSTLDNRLTSPTYRNNCWWSPDPMWRGQAIFLTDLQYHSQRVQDPTVLDNLFMSMNGHGITIVAATAANIQRNRILDVPAYFYPGFPNPANNSFAANCMKFQPGFDAVFEGVLLDNVAPQYIGPGNIDLLTTPHAAVQLNADFISRNTTAGAIMSLAAQKAERDTWAAQRALQTFS